jgi:serine/threonine-protein phosphatase 2A regulatory subunit B
MILLTSNDKTVKLWKLNNKTNNYSNFSFNNGLIKRNSNYLEDLPTIGATRKRNYKNAHGYNIHSVSVNSDGEHFFSADDLRINLWNVESAVECYSK